MAAKTEQALKRLSQICVLRGCSGKIFPVGSPEMRGWESCTSLVTVTILAFVGMVFPAGAAATVEGQITGAVADPAWSFGSFAGEVDQASGCVEAPEAPGSSDPPQAACGWTPFATVGPGSSPGDCSSPGRRWKSIGPGVQLVWLGDEGDGSGSQAFDLTGVALNYGAAAPLLCLSAVEPVLESVECQEGETTCPPYKIVNRYRQLDAATISAEEAPAEDPSSAPLVVSPVTSVVSQVPGVFPPAPCARPNRKARQDRRKGRAAVSSLVRVRGKRLRSRTCL